MLIKPFKGIRPHPDLVERVASRPYDVTNREETKAEAAGNPYSFFHIIRAEIDLPDKMDAHAPEVYQTAQANLNRFLEEGALLADATDCLYVYAQSMNGKTQTGLLCCLDVEDYLNDNIKKHEHTRPSKEKDRITLMTQTRLHSGLILSAYRSRPEIDQIIALITQNPPTNQFNAHEVTHTLWVVDKPYLINALVEAFDKHVPAIYIADGHHRAASSTKTALHFRENNPQHNGTEEYNFFPNVLFPDDQLNIMDYNRLISDLNGLTPDAFLLALEKHFDIERIGHNAFKPDEAHTFSMYMHGYWYVLQAKPHTYNDAHPIDCLDVSVITKYVLNEILDIQDQRTDPRVDFVGGIRGIGELQKRVDAGEWELAMALHPVSIAQLLAVADSGEVMPPKTTWFEPKLCSGLVSHRF